jgi:hypothetical protein
MTFGQALDAMRSGADVIRDGWFGRQWISLRAPASSDRRPYIVLFIANPATLRPTGTEAPFVDEQEMLPDMVPWVATHDDLLANDWYVKK